MTLARLQHVLVNVLGVADPVAALADASGDVTLSADERQHLADIDLDGLRLTALLVKKLRFESILAGDAELRRRYERDPDGLTHAFEGYLLVEPRRAVFPAAEAERFRAFLRRSEQI